MRIEAELGGFARFFRWEGPRGNVHALAAAVDRVGHLRVGCARVVNVGGGQDARSDDHAPLEARGDDSIVEEVFEVDAGDSHDVGLRECLGLGRGHLMFVRGGVGGEQAREAHGQGGPLGGGAHVCALS